MKTAELTGAALDWAVAVCQNVECDENNKPIWFESDWPLDAPRIEYTPSTDWAQGGPIIEREKIELEHDGFVWWARIKADDDYQGTTPLIAAMRCYVASKLGDTVNVPAELTTPN